jgi:DNA-binding transcriptional regulator YdaS (Cro superfamily)
MVDSRWLVGYGSAMQLADYLKKHAISATRFAKQVGKSKSMMTLLLQGKRRPSPELAKEIERQTGGVVPKHELRGDIWDAPKRRAA